MGIEDRECGVENFDSKEDQKKKLSAWNAIVAEYQKPHLARAWWQIINTIFAYILLWYLMYLSLDGFWWIIPLLAILAAGLLVRIFIIFHDCGHGSFFKSRLANNICGFTCGVLLFTPYYHWRWEHAIHHSTSGDLSRRGVGDIWTLTVQEYLEATRWKRFAYRMARNPIVLFVIAPLFIFMIFQRIPSRKANRRERQSVWLMNLAVVSMVTGMSIVFGIMPYLLIQLPIAAIAGSAGIWLFYVQHQFEDVYWERGERWEYIAAALKGSSFYKLPKVLQWFSGNIGFHHIHHLSPRIPNYNLERCHESDPVFQNVKTVTLLSSLKSLSFRLWDESEKKLVSFRHLRKIHKDRKYETNDELPEDHDKSPAHRN
jgi:omega-6 fatty acid desaturase (delta-12 desaturase)